MQKLSWSTSMKYNSTQSKYCLEESTTLKVFKEKLKAYIFILDVVAFLFDIALYQKKKMSHKELII